MLISGNRLPGGITLRSEVCIIGTGPAGLTIARELREAGIRVILLESGDRRTHGPANELLRGESVGYPFPLEASRRRAFGGTSSHWTAETGLRVRPLDAVDLESRSVNGGVGWPISPAELAPYYERAMGSLGLTSGFEPSEWLDPGELAGDWPHERNLAMFQFADHRCFVDTFDGLVRAPGVEVVLDATVLKLRTDPATGAVATAAVSSLDGNRFSVAADRFVLACGGIDNARLLLASQDRNPAGLGNDHDLVGRYFMDHLSIDSGFVRPATRDLPWVELFGERRDERGSKFQAMYWHGEELLRERGLLNAAFWINFEAGSSASPGVLSLRALHGGRLTQPAIAGRARHASQVVLHPIPVSRFTLARVANRYPPPRILAFRIMAEQAPNPDSRITLSGARDRLGVPLARLDWRLSDVDLWSIRQHQDALDEAMQAAGIGKMFGKFGDEQPRATLVSNYHHMGTTRMHPDPRRGVVATDSRVHGVPNLFVAGSSVFPTGGYLNPTLTIIALAMRLAACIRRESGALVLA